MTFVQYVRCLSDDGDEIQICMLDVADGYFKTSKSTFTNLLTGCPASIYGTENTEVNEIRT